MQIKLTNNTLLDCVGVQHGVTTYQGVARDCCTLFFNSKVVALADVEQLFAADNCQKLVMTTQTSETVLVKDQKTGEEQINSMVKEEETVLENYTIRASYGHSFQTSIDEQTYGDDVAALPEDVVWVKLLQTTLAERSIQNQQEVLDALVVEALMREAE
ncbi:MAG: hypothetical protein NC400_12245 [Clostridium sp.]|nr:hypothetical protein [Clostridium sp.]